MIPPLLSEDHGCSTVSINYTREDLRGNFKKTISSGIISPVEVDITRLINIGWPDPGTIKGTKYAVSTDILGSLGNKKETARRMEGGEKVKGGKKEEATVVFRQATGARGATWGARRGCSFFKSGCRAPPEIISETLGPAERFTRDPPGGPPVGSFIRKYYELTHSTTRNGHTVSMISCFLAICGRESEPPLEHFYFSPNNAGSDLVSYEIPQRSSSRVVRWLHEPSDQYDSRATFSQLVDAITG